jgi:hypothetical protein
MFLVIQRNKNFYIEFYVHILCEFFVMSNYDEMNCNHVFGDFYDVFWNVDFDYM